MSDNYESRQKGYYTREINRGIPAPPMKDSLMGAFTTMSGSSQGIIHQTESLFSTFGTDSDAIRRDGECRSNAYPTPSMRDPGARAGCGLWYSPNGQSTGAYGTRRGPMNPNLDSTYGSGQWIWDMNQAAQMEGRKQAAKIQTCPDIQYSRIPNMGWCSATNMAILTDGNGNPAYPQTPGGDCPAGQIVTNASACPVPPPPSSGMPAAPQGLSGLCQPNSSGALSSACLQNVVQQAGCSPNGTLSLALANGYASSYSGFNNMNSILQQRGFTLSGGIVTDGKTSVQDALTNVGQLRTLAGNTDKSRGTLAAQNLCLGTPFDPCQFSSTDTGPFPPDCITKAALAAGWSAKGSSMPANAGMSYWNTLKTWGDVLNVIQSAKSQADNADTQQPPRWQQTDRIGQVYGLGVKYPKQGCNNLGVLMYRYFFPTWDQSLFTAAGPQTHFLGRYIFKQGFPNQPSTMQDQTPSGSYLTEGQRYVANFIPTQGGTYQFLLNHDDGIRMLINDQVFQDWVTNPGNTMTSTINLVADQPYKLTIDLWNGGGPWSFILQMSVNGGAWQNLPLQQLYMTQDRRLPTFELAFNKMPTSTSGAGSTRQGEVIQDTNGVFQNLLRMSAPIGPLNGKQCLNVNGNGSGIFSFAKYSQGARVRAFKSYTMMLQINSVQWGSGASPSIFSLYNLPSSNPTSYPRQGPPADSWDYTNIKQQFMITASATAIYPWGKGVYSGSSQDVSSVFGANAPSAPQIPIGQWFHFAMVWDDDFSGYVLYLNGQPSQHYASIPYDITTIMEQMRIGADGADDGSGWKGGVAWFRAFDYRLSQELIQRDMNDDWASLY